MDCYITAYGAALPQRIMTNEELAQLLSVTPEWIETNSGIRTRHWANADESCSDFGAAALREALTQGDYQNEAIDYLIAATLSPDYQVPGIAPLIQRKIAGLREIPALDIRSGCSAILYSLQMARALILSGSAHNVACVGSEAQSKGLNLSKEAAELSMLFGDGAGAIIVSDQPNKNALQILDIYIASDGQFAEDLTVRAPGTANGKHWFTEAQYLQGLHYGSMNGRKVILQAVRKLSTAANTILTRNQLSSSDIDLIVPHQANLNLLRQVAKQLAVPEEKVVINLDRYGNTSGASAFLALHQASQTERLHSGKYILILAFGAGFTWGSALCKVL